MKLKDILDNDIIFWLLCPFGLLYILWDCIYEDIKDIWDKYYLYFSDKKEYNHKYHPEPEIPWPTDPIERSKCPRVKLVYDNGFEFRADGYQGYKELIYVENNYDAKLNRLFLENKKNTR